MIGGLYEGGVVMLLLWIVNHPLRIIIDNIVWLEVTVVGSFPLESQTLLWTCMLPYS